LAITSPDAVSPAAFKQIQFRLGLRETQGAAKEEAGKLTDNPELESEAARKRSPESFRRNYSSLSSPSALTLAQAPPISNGPTIVLRPAGAQITVSAGFSVDEYATGFTRPRFYLTVGSPADLVTGDPEMRAAVHRFNPDGTGHEVIATGLRNTVGLRSYSIVSEPDRKLWAIMGTGTHGISEHERIAKRYRSRPTPRG
jgi:hypothetical protein